MNPLPKKDLIVLVADKNMEFAIKGILTRHQALGIREVSYDLYVHPERDPGCLNRGHDFVSSFAKSHACAMVVMDRDGCGRESCSPEILEVEIESRLSTSGWAGHTAIVITPELENWVWSDSPHVDILLGWANKTPSLKSWLVEKDFWKVGETKPHAPKEALEAAIRVTRKQRSSSLYYDLATRVGLGGCTDRAFVKLRENLRNWFSVDL